MYVCMYALNIFCVLVCFEILDCDEDGRLSHRDAFTMFKTSLELLLPRISDIHIFNSYTHTLIHSHTHISYTHILIYSLYVSPGDFETVCSALSDPSKIMKKRNATDMTGVNSQGYLAACQVCMYVCMYAYMCMYVYMCMYI